MKWSDLTMTPDDEAVQVLRSAWRWLLGDHWTPILFSVFGDVFFTRDAGVEWLNTGTGEVTHVASDTEAFQEMLGGDSVDEWFLPPLVSALHQENKRPATGQCYTYAIYPIFAEGKYECWNFGVVSAREHFALSGELHQQIKGLADGERVEIKIVD